MMAFVTILSFNACSDSNANQDPNLVAKESNEVAMKDFGKTVPVGIEKEDGKFKISFMVTAQPYEIADSKENTGYISMIRQAVENETPVHVFLKANTNKIAKVEKATDDASVTSNLYLIKKREVKAIKQSVLFLIWQR